MKHFLLVLGLVVTGALLAQRISAADLTGQWVASQPGRGGQPQETSIWIKASGDTFTGYMFTARNGNVPIVDGKTNGDQITFTTVTDNNGEEQRQQYTGSITADGLLIHPPAGGGRKRGRNAACRRQAGAGVKPPLTRTRGGWREGRRGTWRAAARSTCQARFERDSAADAGEGRAGADEGREA